jgi:uncharacterized membrane protein
VAQTDIIAPTEPTNTLPVVRSISPLDLMEVLRKGIDDFRAMPTHVVFLSVLYPVVGLLLFRATLGYDLVPLLYPLAAGFALIGPFAAIGLYELSRRREQGLDTSWKHAFDIIHSPSLGPIAALGLLLLLIFGVWIASAHAIYVSSFGDTEITSVTEFARQVLSTPQGRNLIVVGNSVGFIFAVLAAAVSVVSFPLLLDRNVGFAVAVATSLKAVLMNPLTMAIWGLIVALGLAIGVLPFFFGLAVIMPILGHSTWHLYRKLVEPDRRPRPEFHPKARGTRYAAEFPASLFFPASRGNRTDR